MLTLYYRPTCPFSRKVLNEAANLGIALATKDITDAATAGELLERGGKIQSPYLVDDATGTGLYESRDIVNYLDKHYAKTAA